MLDVDPWLEPQANAILHRHDLFRKWKDTIDETEGGYDAFTKGYEKFGLVVIWLALLSSLPVGGLAARSMIW